MAVGWLCKCSYWANPISEQLRTWGKKNHSYALLASEFIEYHFFILEVDSLMPGAQLDRPGPSNTAYNYAEVLSDGARNPASFRELGPLSLSCPFPSHGPFPHVHFTQFLFHFHVPVFRPSGLRRLPQLFITMPKWQERRRNQVWVNGAGRMQLGMLTVSFGGGACLGTSPYHIWRSFKKNKKLHMPTSNHRISWSFSSTKPQNCWWVGALVWSMGSLT